MRARTLPFALSALVVLSVALEAGFSDHGERWPGFFALLGLAATVVLFSIAKLALGPILSRTEDDDAR